MSGTAFAAIGLALLAIALGALALAYRRRWRDGEATAAAAGRTAAWREATLAAAPLGCLVIAPGGARVRGHPALMAALGFGDQEDAALGAIPEAFEGADAKRFSTAVAALRNQGSGFELRLEARRPTCCGSTMRPSSAARWRGCGPSATASRPCSTTCRCRSGAATQTRT
jgi:hypothetical protein